MKSKNILGTVIVAALCFTAFAFVMADEASADSNVYTISLSEDSAHLSITEIPAGAPEFSDAGDWTYTFTAEEGYMLPADIIVKVGDITLSKSDTTYRWVNGQLTIYQAAITGNAEVKIVCSPAIYDIDTSGLVNMTSNAPAKIAHGTALDIILTRANASGYDFPAKNDLIVKAGETAIAFTYTVGQTAKISIAEDVIDGTLTISGTAVAHTFDVTSELTNLTSADMPATATFHTAIEVNIAAATGYTLPATVMVKVQTDAIEDRWVDYTSRTTFVNGKLTIPADYVIGAIEITAEGVAKTYNVTSRIIDGAVEYADPAKADGVTPFVFFIKPNDGFNIPAAASDIYIWTDGENGIRLTAGTDFTYVTSGEDAGKVTIAAAALADNIYIRAVCTPITYSITYVTGTTEVITQDDVGYGQTITLASVKTIKDDCKFVGWVTTVNVDGDDYTIFLGSAGYVVKPTQDATITAVWIAEGAATIDLIFNTNGGSSLPNEKVAKYTTSGSQTTYMPVPPTKTGFEFVGWFANKECTIPFSFGATELTANTTVFAGWEEVETPTTYTVTFYSNGGSNVDAIKNIVPGKTITLPADPVRNGYTFAGWFTNATLGDSYRFNATQTIQSDMSLYAKWTPVSSGGNDQPAPTPSDNTKTESKGTNWFAIAFVAVGGILGGAYVMGYRHPLVIVAAVALVVVGIAMFATGSYEVKDIIQFK